MPKVLTRLMGVIVMEAPIDENFGIAMRDDANRSLVKTDRLTKKWSRQGVVEQKEAPLDSQIIAANYTQLNQDLQERYTEAMEMLSRS